jgi:hypothetical protein
MEDIIAKVQELVAAFGIKVATALLVLVIGRWVAKYLRDLTGKMMGKSNTNYTMKEKRRVDLVFGVSYGEEIEKVKRVIAGVLGSDARILKVPSPTVAVLGIDGGSVTFAVRPWVRTLVVPKGGPNPHGFPTSKPFPALLLPGDDPTGDPISGIPGRIRHFVVRLRMDDDRSSVRIQERRRVTPVEGCAHKGRRQFSRPVRPHQQIGQIARMGTFGAFQSVFLRMRIVMPPGRLEVRRVARPDSVDMDPVQSRRQLRYLYHHSDPLRRLRQHGGSYGLPSGIFDDRFGGSCPANHPREGIIPEQEQETCQ